jgi:AcrR family transcriptional regulator
MPKNATDRRVSRTKAMLQQAHLTLILEQGYEATTVEAICGAANVGRSTFYAHYRSKHDLKRSGLDDLRAHLLARQREALQRPGTRQDRCLGFSLALFSHARDYLDLYRALAGGRGREVALGGVRKILFELVRNEVVATNGKDSAAVASDLSIQFIVGAYMATLTWWLDRGAKLPPEEIDGLFRRMVTEGVFPAYA